MAVSDLLQLAYALSVNLAVLAYAERTTRGRVPLGPAIGLLVNLPLLVAMTLATEGLNWWFAALCALPAVNHARNWRRLRRLARAP